MSIVPQLFDNLEKEDQSTGIGKASVLRAYLHIFLIYMQRVYEEVHRHQVATHASALARRFNRLVVENCIVHTNEQDMRKYAKFLISADIDNHLPPAALFPKKLKRSVRL